MNIRKTTIDIQAQKLELIHLLQNTKHEHVLSRLKDVFEETEEGLDLEVKKQMVSTAKKSEEDIKAESILEQRLGY